MCLRVGTNGCPLRQLFASGASKHPAVCTRTSRLRPLQRNGAKRALRRMEGRSLGPKARIVARQQKHITNASVRKKKNRICCNQANCLLPKALLCLQRIDRLQLCAQITPWIPKCIHPQEYNALDGRIGIFRVVVIVQ